MGKKEELVKDELNVLHMLKKKAKEMPPGSAKDVLTHEVDKRLKEIKE